MYKIEFSDNYLSHHGILGQKWGVQNGPPYPLTNNQKSKDERTSFSLTSYQKKYLKIGASAAVGALALYGGYKLYKSFGHKATGLRLYGLDEPLRNHLLDYPNNDILLPKGTSLQRVSSSSFEDLANKGHIYVSYKFRDNQRYLSNFRKEVNMSGKRDFVHRIKSKDDLKFASPRKAAEIVLDQNPQIKDNTFRLVINPYVVRDENNDQVSRVLGSMRSHLINELSKQGYAGIIDFEDSAKAKNSFPLIVFNPDSHVSVQNSRKIGSFESFVARLLA